LHQRYRLPNGTDIVFESRVSTNLSFWPPTGAAVEVLYDPSDPRHARLNHFTELLMMPLFFVLFGGMFFGITLFASASARRKQVPLVVPPSAENDLTKIIR
jgi:hypothetical protein